MADEGQLGLLYLTLSSIKLRQGPLKDRRLSDSFLFDNFTGQFSLPPYFSAFEPLTSEVASTKKRKAEDLFLSLDPKPASASLAHNHLSSMT